MKEVLHIKQWPKQTVQKRLSNSSSFTQHHYMLHCTYAASRTCDCMQQALTYLLPIHLCRNWGQSAGELAQWHDVFCSSADITHSCDDNSDSFYGKVTAFPSTPDENPLKHAESMWYRKRSNILPGFVQGISLSLCKQKGWLAACSHPVSFVQSVFASDIWTVGCTFGHRSRTVGKKKVTADLTPNCKRKEKLPHGKKIHCALYILCKDALWDGPELPT